MKILVTGSRGQVGKAMIVTGVKHGLDMIGYSKENLDITSNKNIKDVFNFEKPDIIVNTAAYTNVDRAEKETKQAFDVNEKGVFFLSQICSAFKIPLIHISTDYVFDGKSNKPYTELNKTCPINIYGKSKESGEKAIRENIKQHIILRTSWVFSPDGNNFVNTMMSMVDKKKNINVVDDQFGGPTSVDGISEAILSIVNRYKNNSKVVWGTYNFSGNPNISRYDFANQIFRIALSLKLSKKIPTIKPVKSLSYPTFAQRPANSQLDCAKIYKNFGINTDDWKSQLTKYLSNRLKYE